MGSRLTLYCDRCDLDDRNAEGKAERLGVGSTWYEIHLCEQCRKEFSVLPFETVVAFFRDHGEVLASPGTQAADGQMPCLWCDKSYGTTGGLDAHLRVRHHFTTSEDAWGHRCPACGSEDFSRMGTHSSRSHHRHISVLMQEAIHAGDPYGVVRERLRAGRRR